jgi:hypothetical protein
MRSFYQDRLGINIGKALKARPFSPGESPTVGALSGGKSKDAAKWCDTTKHDTCHTRVVFDCVIHVSFSLFNSILE